MSADKTQPHIRIAVDIGGTFTDLEFSDLTTGRSYAFKTPTTPNDPSKGLAAAVTGAAARHGFSVDDIAFLIHGTTIATNAVLTGNLPPGALITTSGFEDVVEIGRHSRREIYGLRANRGPPLVPRHRRYGVQGRSGPTGEILQDLDVESVNRAAEDIIRQDIKAVAVALLHAYANPEQEMAIRDILLQRDPTLFVSLSHEVSPEIREFERTATTVLNALLMPIIRSYVSGLQQRRAEIGLKAPLYLVQSNGGACTLEKALTAPVNLILSGPSGGVLASERVASDLNQPNVVAVDMGGTSYDISIIENSRRTLITAGEIGHYPVRVPMVDMRTIGAGGGSIVSVDATGRLTVGPESAGAVPGPICYRRGGQRPTITDANLVLGRLDPASFLKGDMGLDAEAARNAIDSQIAVPLSLSPEESAEGIIEVVNSKLSTSVKLALFERGLDPRDFALMSFGGAGGLHATEVAEHLGMRTVIYPKDPSTFSALGLLTTDIVHELAQPRLLPFRESARDVLAGLAAQLKHDAMARLDEDGIPTEDRAFSFKIDARYRKQAFELIVDVEDPDFSPSEIERLKESFHKAHLQRFSFDDREETIECVTLRLSATGRLGSFEMNRSHEASVLQPKGRRRIFYKKEWAEIPIYAAEVLPENSTLVGPVILEQDYTTIFLTTGWSISGTAGHFIARKKDVA